MKTTKYITYQPQKTQHPGKTISKKVSLTTLGSGGKSKTPGYSFKIKGEYHLMHQAPMAGIMWIKTDARLGISCKIKAFLKTRVAPAKGPYAIPQKM